MVDAGSEEAAGIAYVLSRLLVLGVGDDDCEIRAGVFDALTATSSLDVTVTRSRNIDCIVEALNDEAIDVRTGAMSLLARVAHHDSVHIMPLVRLTLSKLMRQIQNSRDAVMKQEGVQLLQVT